MKEGYKKTALGDIPVDWEVVKFGSLIKKHGYGPRFNAKDYDEEYIFKEPL